MDTSYQSYLAPKAITDPTAGLSSASKAKIHKAAGDFESMFLSEMLKPMFDQEETNPMFGGGQSEQIYRSMLVDEYGKQISKAGGIGIAKTVEKEMLAKQAAAEKATSLGTKVDLVN